MRAVGGQVRERYGWMNFGVMEMSYISMNAGLTVGDKIIVIMKKIWALNVEYLK